MHHHWLCGAAAASLSEKPAYQDLHCFPNFHRVCVNAYVIVLQTDEHSSRTHSNSFGSPPSPGYFTDGTPSGPLLTEPTQLEVCIQ